MAEASLIPKHVGFIIDGNRRWAKKHGLPTYEGHLAGYNALKEVALEVLASGVEYMSIYIFSTENWKRSAEEIKGLMSLILKLFTTDAEMFMKHDVRVQVIGSKEGLDQKIIKSIDALENKTKQNTAGTLVVCLNYGGQLEIIDAVKKLVQSGVDVTGISAESIEQHLYGDDIPAVDLIVRTSGEHRISNFMLWRSAYSELLFLKKMWPEMTKQDVQVILKEYAKRQRRFGG